MTAINKFLRAWSFASAGLWFVFVVNFFALVGSGIRWSEDVMQRPSWPLFTLTFFAFLLLISLVGLIIAIVATVQTPKVARSGHALAIVGFALALTLVGFFIAPIVLLIIGGVMLRKSGLSAG